MAAAEVQEQLQAALGGSYTLQRELGRGGMATVFLAMDVKHRRPVALKVFHTDLATSLGPERFRREISFAAKLQHPHILTVMDSGETPTGQLWFTMPYVDGETLRERLRRQRQLPLDDALRIGHEVALALEYAHRHGVVHRDVKPENILLTSDGQALVADFGIARALASSASPEAGGTGTLTQTGVAVGTPSYMSPEQASGERTLDGTTDVYSLGTVMYEMLAGEPPFTGPSAQAVIAKMMASEPPSVRWTRPSVPEAVDRAIGKALAPVPADRFATAADFAKALDPAQRAESGPKPARRRIPIAATLLGLGLLVAAGLLFAWRSHQRTLAVSTGAVRLAVLPFENVGDSADAYFADGMSEEITARVSRVPGVNVIGRTSVLQYRRSGKTAPEFGRTLGVQYVLDGTVRWARASNGAKRVRITPALIRVSDGTQVWGEPYDGVPADVFELQSDVAERVTQSLRGTLLPGERRALRTAPTEDLAAYRLYLLGREEWRKRTTGGLQRAAAYFQQAIDRDPNYAQAYAGLADAYAVYWEYGIRALPRDTVYARATAAASRALTIDSTLAEGHAALGQILVNLWHWPEAERELRRAIELDPNYASAHQWYAEYLMMQGRLDEALAQASTAVGLDPLAGIVANAYGLSLAAKGRPDEAICGLSRRARARLDTHILAARPVLYLCVHRPTRASASAANSDARHLEPGSRLRSGSTRSGGTPPRDRRDASRHVRHFRVQ